ncbi:restriction endonuclease subunit S, partial [Ruegeria intermedia]|uniref:restriction endonuclease subunit S n=1 Tax=Ruegeria intermedia TaxID=996115 RepID=UPI0021D23DF1
MLGEICEAGGGGIQTGPFGSQLHASDYVPVGIPSIMPQNIGDNRIVADGIARISEEDAIRLSKYRVEPGDIVYSRRGDVERRALIRSSEDGWLCGTGCLRVRLGDGPADPAFVAFYLGTPEAREWIVRHAHGATMPNLNTSILAACPIVVPPLPEQRAIAGVLSALDDKIELNRRTGATLEAMARAIFRDWFVDFGPTRAKAEGREPYLAPDLWPLFPARLNDQGIPEGWEVSEIGKEITAVGGSTPSTKEPSYWGGGVNWATPKDLSPL